MKKIITILGLTVITALSLNAAQINMLETNKSPVAVISTNTLVSTNDVVEFNKVDVTFDAAGIAYSGQHDFGLDVSASIDPFQKLPNLWVGISQSLYWQPTLAASTDIDADWNFQVYKQLYVQLGWSVGDVYGDNIPNLERTGPEVIGQYYLGDDVYLYGAVNYDMVTQDSKNGWQLFDKDNNGFRYSFGIGFEF